MNIIVRDLRDKKGVSPILGFIGWGLFRAYLPSNLYLTSVR